MRRRAMVVLVLLATSSAFAQSPVPIMSMQWAVRPTVADYARLYPAEALQSGVGAQVRLDCVVQGDQTLQCSVVSEMPAGLGFAEASLEIAKVYRAEAQISGTPTEAGRAILTIRWLPEAVREYNRG
jgi:hypothetical protein